MINNNYIFYFLYIFIYNLLLVTPSFAEGVYIEANQEVGQGILRSRGEECYIITACHVVNKLENSGEAIAVTHDKTNYQYKVVEKYDLDIAILQIMNNTSKICHNEDDDDINIDDLIDKYPDYAELKFLLQNGSIIRLPVSIKGIDPFKYLKIYPKFNSDKIIKGMSGSPVFINNILIGIVLSVDENGNGKVIRLDFLNDVVRSFFNTPSRIGSKPFDKNKTNELKLSNTYYINLPSNGDLNIIKISEKIKKELQLTNRLSFSKDNAKYTIVWNNETRINKIGPDSEGEFTFSINLSADILSTKTNSIIKQINAIDSIKGKDFNSHDLLNKLFGSVSNQIISQL